MSVLDRLLPAYIDNRFRGNRAALWLLGIYIALRLVMSFNSIINTRSVATGADGLTLDAWTPASVQVVLLLFALVAVGQLFLNLFALLALVRYRAMVPLVFALLLLEQLCRRALVFDYSVAGEAAPVGTYINLGLTAILFVGLVLSLIGSEERRSPSG